MFGKKKTIELIEQKFEELKKSIPDFSKINNFEMDLQKIQSHIVSLRGLVNRKLEFPNAKDEDLSPDGVLVKTKG
jgi:hypothetical protein